MNGLFCRWGRKRSLTISCVMYIVAGPVAAFSPHYLVFCFARLALGMAGSGTFNCGFTLCKLHIIFYNFNPFDIYYSTRSSGCCLDFKTSIQFEFGMERYVLNVELNLTENPLSGGLFEHMNVKVNFTLKLILQTLHYLWVLIANGIFWV